MIFLRLALAEVPVDPATGGVEDAPRAGPAHRLHDVVGQDGSLIEIDLGLGGGASNVRVRREVDDDIMTGHGLGQQAEIAHIAADDAQPPVT